MGSTKSSSSCACCQSTGSSTCSGANSSTCSSSSSTCSCTCTCISCTCCSPSPSNGCPSTTINDATDGCNSWRSCYRKCSWYCLDWNDFWIRTCSSCTCSSGSSSTCTCGSTCGRSICSYP